MSERFTPPPFIIGELGVPTLTSAVEFRPPAGKKVLFLSAEPHANLLPTHQHTVPDPDQDIYTQWILMAHNMHPDDLHSVPIYDPEAHIPDIMQFAGITGGGSGSMITDGGKSVEKFKHVLRKATEAELVTLATCYTYHALMEALGAEIRYNPSGERKFGVGEYVKTQTGERHWMLAGLPTNFVGFRSHLQEVNPDSLPPGVEVLAVDAHDRAIAAVGIGEWGGGIQLHNDLSLLAMIGLSRTPTRRKEIERTGRTVPQVIQSMTAAEPAAIQTNRIINRNFQERIHTRHKLTNR